MVFLTAPLVQKHIRRQYIRGSGVRYITGDGIFDWIKLAARKILPILKPVLGIAAKTMLPAAVQAIEQKSFDPLKAGLKSTIKQAVPGALSQASDQLLQGFNRFMPALTPMLSTASQAAQNFANDQISGLGMHRGKVPRGAKKRQKEIDALIKGSGLMIYSKR